MKRISAVAILAIGITSIPAAADDQPPGNSGLRYLPNLADIMGATQLRHFKLWYAGNVRNWSLAHYELQRIDASFQDAMKFYPNFPQANMKVMAPSAEEIGQAIEAKDGARFEKGFERMTSACNSCHEQAGLGFIYIHVPRTSPIETSPFSDQGFEPRR
jgi:hypothetical protein